MKPEWLTIKPHNNSNYNDIKNTVSSLNLHTVCTEAKCPNITECWDGGTATFMVLGEKCTRGCGFCAVSKMAKNPEPDPLEPTNLAKAIKEWKLNYVVITSVCRDDLPDQGSSHVAKCIEEIKKLNQGTNVEILSQDFAGDRECIKRVIDAKPDVFAHNIETVERLTEEVRDRRATYSQSLSVLKTAKEMDHNIYTKSSIMLGFGESDEEIIKSMNDLRSVKVDFLTLGQYLKPPGYHIEVKEYVTPQKFEELRKIALGLGFAYVAAGPFVRSSYKAGEYFKNMIKTS